MKTLSIKTLVFSLILILTMPSMSFASNYSVSNEVNVSRDEADLVVGTFIQSNGFPESMPQLTSVSPMYDMNDELLAYYYKFNHQYVLVSANKEYSPVLAASPAGSLDITELNSNGKLYYFGGISAAQALNTEEIIINSSEKVNNESKSMVDSNVGLAKNPNSEASWDHYLKTSAERGTALAMMQKKLTMTTFDQYGTGVTNQASACGPATMAAISEYWRVYRGFNLVPSPYFYGSQTNMINHFYNEHGGTIIGMGSATMQMGLEFHHDEFYASADADPITGYSSYRTEINNNRPVAVKFDRKFTFYEPNNDYAYPYHWTVGKGFSYDNFDSMFIVNDNTGDEDHQEHYIDFPTNEPILSLVKFSM
ncbi:Spi family protease inhibitor [Paenibacillus sp. FSL F4-0236]|uniref:Spi family protease inhibitor n=1 Tax=Paenibacillus sp. FSL F4-0236 TaxID=2954731 RepID=UPI0030FB074B